MKLNRRVEFALEFASLLHEDQGHRYGDAPYAEHLKEVVNTLLNFGIVDKNMLTAGYLHDVVEDVKVHIGTIEDLFGPEVATLVHAVSDEPGANRKERKAKTYPKIKATPGAVEIKVADRIANVNQTINGLNYGMFKMYQQEQPGFQAALRTIGQSDDMWAFLDALFIQGKQRFDNRPTRTVTPELG